MHTGATVHHLECIVENPFCGSDVCKVPVWAFDERQVRAVVSTGGGALMARPVSGIVIQ
jgi:hypothetical protein